MQAVKCNFQKKVKKSNTNFGKKVKKVTLLAKKVTNFRIFFYTLLYNTRRKPVLRAETQLRQIFLEENGG